VKAGIIAQLGNDPNPVQLALILQSSKDRMTPIEQVGLLLCISQRSWLRVHWLKTLMFLAFFRYGLFEADRVA
jgi:hypothetical protein